MKRKMMTKGEHHTQEPNPTAQQQQQQQQELDEMKRAEHVYDQSHRIRHG